MKNSRIILALILIITTLTACRSADSDEPVNMEELMKIRTWMVDKDLEGKGHRLRTRMYLYTRLSKSVYRELWLP